MQKNIKAVYPQLKENTSADILIKGAGITGLITAYTLLKAGHKVAVAESHTVGGGFTRMLMGEANPSDSVYKLSGAGACGMFKKRIDAVKKLLDISKSVKDPAFSITQTLYFTDREGHTDNLLRLYGLCSCEDKTVRLLDNPLSFKDFCFDIECGIHSDLGGVADCKKLADGLADFISLNGGELWENTRIVSTSGVSDGSIDALTDNGSVIRAKFLVDCTGEYQDRISCRNVSFFNAECENMQEIDEKDFKCNLTDDYRFTFRTCTMGGSVIASLRIPSLLAKLKVYKNYNLHRVENILNAMFDTRTPIKVNKTYVYTVKEPVDGIPCILQNKDSGYTLCNTACSPLINAVVLAEDTLKLFNRNADVTFPLKYA